MKHRILRTSFLAATLAGGIALTAHAQILVEDFEGSAPWSADADRGANTINTDQSRSGSQSYQTVTIDDMLTWNSFGGLNGDFSISIFQYLDSSVDVYGRSFLDIRTGSASEVFAIGVYNAGGVDASEYAIRAVGQGEWMASGVPLIKDEWVELNISRTGSDITFSIDGNPLETTYTSSAALDTLRLGSGLAVSTSPAHASYDDLSVIPEPSTYAAIFGGIALLGAFIYRRRIGSKK